MLSKKLTRQRRARRSRAHIRRLGAVRLGFYKSNQHLYAQLVKSALSGDEVITSLSTLTKDLKLSGKNNEIAAKLGEAMASRAKQLGFSKVAFDRSGNKYHGRVQSFADAARAGGLEF